MNFGTIKPRALRTWFAFAAAGILAGLAVPASAAGIEKGPYLMNPTPTGITVCWVSDAPAIGTVKIAGRNETAQDEAATRYHRVHISGSVLVHALPVFCYLRR